MAMLNVKQSIEVGRLRPGEALIVTSGKEGNQIRLVVFKKEKGRVYFVYEAVGYEDSFPYEMVYIDEKVELKIGDFFVMEFGEGPAAVMDRITKIEFQPN
jgi:hypothetical protein